MELARFHSAIDDIAADYIDNKTEHEFNVLINNLNALVANPGNPQVSQAFKDHLNAFRNTLTNSKLNLADGDLLQTLNDLDLNKFIGEGLFSEIRSILDDNQLTPNLAVIAIDKLKTETSSKYSNIIAINDSFTKLEIAYSDLNNGETEMLIKLPIEEETITLSEFSKETKEWYTICEAISETFDSERTRVTIRTVGSGSILLYLAATATFIYGVAKCLKGVNLVLAEVIRSKALYKQLVSTNAPTAVLEPLEKHNNGKAKTDIYLLASNLVDDFYKGTDEPRKNELKNSLSFSLTKLSHKLATGSKISLRLSAPEAPKIAEGEKPTTEQNKILKEIDIFQMAEIEVSSSLAAIDYKEHAADLVAALPAPNEEKPTNQSETKTGTKRVATKRIKKA
jgi:hypothetical protein